MRTEVGGVDGAGVTGLRRALPLLGSLAVAVVVVGPALGPGQVLLRDMVVVPRQVLTPDALGAGDALPRAVPADAVLALLTAVVPGALVQKVVLLAAVALAVLGASRLVPPGPDGRRGPAAAVAGLVYGWSPYLAERLLMGHWTLLLGWAMLPWVFAAAGRLRRRERRAAARLLLVMAPAAVTPTGAVLAVVVALAGAGPRRAPVVLGAGALLSAPWVVAGLVHPAGAGTPAQGVAAFAARAEGAGGAVAALLGTGGIWNAAAVPPSRASAAVLLVTAVLVALSAVGVRRAAPGDPARRLLPAGLAGLVLAALGVLPGLRDLLGWAVTAVPGAGLLRDGQKWVALWGLALAAGVGAALAGPLRARPGRVVPVPVLLVIAALLPVLSVPDLAWGVAGRLQPVGYPAEWQRVRTLLADDPRPGEVLVLPAGAIRAFDWNGRRPVLDPAPRFLTRPTVVDGTLAVSGRTVDPPDTRTRTVISAAGDPVALGRLGVGWVLVERGTPGRPVPRALAELPVVHAGQWLELRVIEGASAPPGPAPGRLAVVVAGHVVPGVVVSCVTLWLLWGAFMVALRRHRQPNRDVP